MTPTLMDRIRARLAASPGKVIVVHPIWASAEDAVRVALLEKWVRVLSIVPASQERSSSVHGDAGVVFHDERLVDRYIDVWRWARGPRGVGESEARAELARSEVMAAAMVLGGQADAILMGGPEQELSSPTPAAYGAGLSDCLLVEGRAVPGAFVLQARPNPDPTALNLAEVARRGIELARRCGAGEPQVRFVMGTVTASLGSRRRYESEEAALRSRIAEAIRTTRARDREALVAEDPVAGFPPLGERPEVLVVCTAPGEDLWYRLE
jgi:hypothetical protein